MAMALTFEKSIFRFNEMLSQLSQIILSAFKIGAARDKLSKEHRGIVT